MAIIKKTLAPEEALSQDLGAWYLRERFKDIYPPRTPRHPEAAQSPPGPECLEMLIAECEDEDHSEDKQEK